MSSRPHFVAGPDYAHLLGARVRLTFESGQICDGRILRQIKGAMRADFLVVSVDDPVISPAGTPYPYVTIAMKAGGYYSERTPVDSYVLVAPSTGPASVPLSAEMLQLATSATAILLPSNREEKA